MRQLAVQRYGAAGAVGREEETKTGDIIYIWTAEGWLHLAVVLDLFSRRVVGWPPSRRMTARLAMGALEMALWRRRPEYFIRTRARSMPVLFFSSFLPETKSPAA